MKRILFTLAASLMVVSVVSAEIDKTKCDNIKKKIRKADCIAQLKAEILIKKSSNEIEIMNKKKKNLIKKIKLY